MATAIPLRFLASLTFLLSAQAAHVEATRDPNRLVHELFAPSANVVAVNAAVSGPANAIAIFSGADRDIQTGSKSGVILSTGDAMSQSRETGREGTARAERRALPQTSEMEFEIPARGGDDQLTQLSAAKTSDAATLSFQFQTTGDTKNLRINFAFVTQESADRIAQGFDDVFAVFIDGELAQYVRASDAKEGPEKENGALSSFPSPQPSPRGEGELKTAFGAGGGPRRTGTRPTSKDFRVVTQSKLIEVSPNKTHSIKLAIADVGDNNGDSFAFVSITGSDDPPPFFGSVPAPPGDLVSIKGPPKTTPPITTPPPPVSPPVTALSGPKHFEVPPPDPKYAPPVPPYIAPAPPTVSVSDHSNSIILLAVGISSLLLLRMFCLRKPLSS